jgi:branched-chain amino acid transport system substrate-binding protein
VASDDQIARRPAEFCKQQGYKRLVTYYVNDDYGKGLANTFEAQATELGCTVVDRLSYNSASTSRDFGRDLKAWKRDFSFDAIFLAGLAPQAAEVIVAARQLGIDAPIMGGDGLNTPRLWEIGGDLVDGTIAVTFFHPDSSQPEVKAFDQDFLKRYGQRPDADAMREGMSWINRSSLKLFETGSLSFWIVAEEHLLFLSA